VADRLEDRAELRAVDPLRFIELPREIADRRGHAPEAHEGAHDLHVDLYCARTVQHAGKHRHSLLGEGVGARAARTSPT